MDLIEALAKEFTEDAPILFIGSGVSINSNLPDWWNLILWLKEYTKEVGGNVAAAEAFHNKKFATSNDLINATSALTNELVERGKTLANFFIEYPKCEAFKHAPLHEIHNLIAQLPTSSLITPNYDLLLENSFDSIGKPTEVVHRGDHEKLNKICRGKLSSFIYKYHGCISNPESIVLDFKQYNSEINGISVDQESLRSLLMSRTFVFIGTGLEDPDFNHIRDRLIHVLKAHNLKCWAFIPNSSDYVNYFEQEYGIKLISYQSEGKDHSDLLNKLNDLLLKIRALDEQKADAIEIAAQVKESPEAVPQTGILKEVLTRANEKVMPLDKEILGFVAFFDVTKKEEFFHFFHDYKGNELDSINNRIDYLIQSKLLKSTEHYFLPVKANYSSEAAEQIEEEVMVYLMEQENG